MATYAISDLHGRFDLLTKIKKRIKDSDTVFCLGDCGDRGPESFKTIKGVAMDARFIYLKGNHEDMLVGALSETLDLPAKIIYRYEEPTQLLYENGGMNTLNEVMESDNPEYWMTYLSRLPLMTTYINNNGYNLILTHAGPSNIETATDKDLLWDRDSDKICYVPDYIKLIHGHTPIPLLQNNWCPQDGSYKYNFNRKICIDFGSVVTDTACLFNLDTFEEELIQ